MISNEGKKHDKKIADEEGYEFPEGSTVWHNTGFQGYAPQGVTSKQPKKKSRNGELTDAKKEENRQISKVRVEVEHPIGGIKRCQNWGAEISELDGSLYSSKC